MKRITAPASRAIGDPYRQLSVLLPVEEKRQVSSVGEIDDEVG